MVLAGAVAVGPRIGKFNADGSSNVLSGHSIPYVVIGTFILFFGWFGFNIDDPLGAISVHGVTGLWGLLAVGIFANGNNRGEGLVVGEGKQIISQLISMGVVMAWGLVTGFALFLLLKTNLGVRTTEAEELEGSDFSENGLQAYGGD